MKSPVAKRSARSSISHLVESKGRFLLPVMNVKEAVAEFRALGSGSARGLDSVSDLRVLGTEAHALRRYSKELDQRHRGARKVRTGIRAQWGKLVNKRTS
jgi:hypothetical protein